MPDLKDGSMVQCPEIEIIIIGVDLAEKMMYSILDL